jgi:hypothetical protein
MAIDAFGSNVLDMHAVTENDGLIDPLAHECTHDTGNDESHNAQTDDQHVLESHFCTLQKGITPWVPEQVRPPEKPATLRVVRPGRRFERPRRLASLPDHRFGQEVFRFSTALSLRPTRFLRCELRCP